MGFSVIRNRISITRGDSAQITLTIRDRVTGKLFVPGPDDRLTFTVKRELSDEAPLVVKTLDNGIVRREQECILLLVPEDTASLPFGTYRYDVELVLAFRLYGYRYPAQPVYCDWGGDGSWNDIKEHWQGKAHSAECFRCRKNRPGLIRKKQ